MIRQSTIELLKEMRFGGMASELECQQSDTETYRDMPFDDRLAMLVEAEWNRRQANKYTRCVHNARFAIPGATLEGIEYFEDRKLSKKQMIQFSTCKYVEEGHLIIFRGASGNGKTYLACALGMAAVRNFYTVKYIRLPELLTELAIARNNGTFRKVIQQYKKPSLLILDEWLLYSLKDTEARDLLEIAEARYKKASTIFCSQFDVPGWCDKIGDPLIADAICDRSVHNAYRIVIECKESMRKRMGMISEA